jgi:hypothetical protein
MMSVPFQQVGNSASRHGYPGMGSISRRRRTGMYIQKIGVKPAGFSTPPEVLSSRHGCLGMDFPFRRSIMGTQILHFRFFKRMDGVTSMFAFSSNG